MSRRIAALGGLGQPICPYHGDVTVAHAHELPPEPGEQLVLSPEEVTAVERDGDVVILTRGGRPVAKVHAIDPDQAWFWTPEWQARERDVDEETAAGVPDREFDSGEEFLAYLEALIEDPSKL
jgi:antitoxin (DNA-binding transcriptional repressor) of toxin-antitoxin stability system